MAPSRRRITHNKEQATAAPQSRIKTAAATKERLKYIFADQILIQGSVIVTYM